MFNDAITAARKAKEPLYKRVWVWVVVVVVLSVVISAASGRDTSSVSTPSAPVAEQPDSGEAAPAPPAVDYPGVGGTVAWDGYGSVGTITLNGIRRVETPESPIGQPATNGSYLVANFTVSITEGTGSANPLFFRAQSPDGATYTSELTVLTRQIDSAQIPAGRQVRGDVAFDAPVGDLLLDYSTLGGVPLATFAVNG